MLYVADVLRCFLQNVGIAAVYAADVVNIRSVNQLFFPFGPVARFYPEVISVCDRTIDSLNLIGKEQIISVSLIQSGDGDFSVLQLKIPLAIADSRLAALSVKRIGKGAAVPEQLGVVIRRMADGQVCNKGS